MFRKYFLSFTTSKSEKKSNLPKPLLAKLQCFFVDIMINAMMEQMVYSRTINQVLKLVCFKDLD